MLDRFVPGFVIGAERESSLTHIHPGGGSQLSHPFWRDTNGAVDGACGGKHFSVMLQRNVAVYRNRRFQSERANTANGMARRVHYFIATQHPGFGTESAL